MYDFPPGRYARISKPTVRGGCHRSQATVSPSKLKAAAFHCTTSRKTIVVYKLENLFIQKPRVVVITVHIDSVQNEKYMYICVCVFYPLHSLSIWSIQCSSLFFLSVGASATPISCVTYISQLSVAFDAMWCVWLCSKYRNGRGSQKSIVILCF